MSVYVVRVQFAWPSIAFVLHQQ